jgi:hypothetical protein
MTAADAVREAQAIADIAPVEPSRR